MRHRTVFILLISTLVGCGSDRERPPSRDDGGQGGDSDGGEHNNGNGGPADGGETGANGRGSTAGHEGGASSGPCGEGEGCDAQVDATVDPNCIADGLAEICDGLDNDCDSATADGSADAALGSACDGSDTDACAEGKVVCNAGALLCDDESADNLDSCDGEDNDCDGQTDEACTVATFAIREFDVQADGAAVAVGLENSQVKMMCFGPDGAVVRPAFVVAEPPAPGDQTLNLEVARSHTTGNIIVAYTYRRGTEDWLNYVAFFDANCLPVGSPQVLDADLVNEGLNRLLTVGAADDGKGYVLYEHESEKKLRAQVFNPNGTRASAISMARPSECAGDGRPGRLVLDAQSGNFAVFCEGSSTRNFKRFTAAGEPLDATLRTVLNSAPDNFSFFYWGVAMNRASQLLFFGRVNDTDWIVRLYDAAGQSVSSPPNITGTKGVGSPRALVTSGGDFLLELGGPDYQLALVSPAGEVKKSWATSPGKYRLDARDHVYVITNNGIVRSRNVILP